MSAFMSSLNPVAYFQQLISSEHYWNGQPMWPEWHGVNILPEVLGSRAEGRAGYLPKEWAAFTFKAICARLKALSYLYPHSITDRILVIHLQSTPHTHHPLPNPHTSAPPHPAGLVTAEAPTSAAGRCLAFMSALYLRTQRVSGNK